MDPRNKIVKICNGLSPLDSRDRKDVPYISKSTSFIPRLWYTVNDRLLLVDMRSPSGRDWQHQWLRISLSIRHYVNICIAMRKHSKISISWAFACAKTWHFKSVYRGLITEVSLWNFGVFSRELMVERSFSSFFHSTVTKSNTSTFR